MWPFKRPPPPTEVPTEVYARWLQAQRPQPFAWFAGQSDEVQLTLAQRGVDQRIEATIELAKAIHNPALFEAECYAETDPDAVEYLLRHHNANASQTVHGSPSPEMAPEPSPGSLGQSFAGVLASQEADTEARIKATGNSQPFLGQLPDSAREDPSSGEATG